MTDQYVKLDHLTSNHYRCYQMQYNPETNLHDPVFIGLYPEVPIHVLQIFGHLKYICHLVSRVITLEEIQQNRCRLIGIDMVLPDHDTPDHSYDLVYYLDQNKYYLELTHNNSENIVKKDLVDKFPGTDQVIEYLLERFFDR